MFHVLILREYCDKASRFVVQLQCCMHRTNLLSLFTVIEHEPLINMLKTAIALLESSMVKVRKGGIAP